MVARNIGFANGDMRNATGRAHIGSNVWALRSPAHLWLEAFAQAFYRRFGYTLPILETMRSLEKQEYYWHGWVNRLPGFNLAASPGTSNHGWGLAVDFGSPLNSVLRVEHQWMVDNAPRFGWWWAGGQDWWTVKEPWHFEWDGRNVGNTIPTKSELAGKLVVDNILGRATWSRWQECFNVTVTGVGGRDFIRKVQRHMSRKRKTPIPVTGLLDTATIDALASWVGGTRKNWVKKLQKQLNTGLHSWPIDENGLLTAETWARWQTESGRKATGKGGRDFIRHIQRHMNRKRAANKQLKVDGIFGRATITAVQEWINSPGLKDGITSTPSIWVRKLQQQLNAGTHSWGA